jgi:uncharacterized protein
MISASVVALLLAQASLPASYSEIQQLICVKKMEEARELAHSVAKAGDPEGFNALGWFEEIGTFSKPDSTRAFAYYTTAATLGSAHAQWKVGVMLDTGLGTARNSKAAVRWFRKSAHQKLGAAWASLGLMQQKGYGTRVNMAAAKRSYQKAIRLGEPHGYAGIGALLATRSVDGSKRYFDAIAWYQVAADQGSDVAREKLQKLPAMTPEQRVWVKDRAIAIIQRHPIKLVPFNRPCPPAD